LKSREVRALNAIGRAKYDKNRIAIKEESIASGGEDAA
jgi:hypothetical protein